MRAAVVDVGSNSIKLLVADRDRGGELKEVVSRTLEVRIGTGIGSKRPSLSPGGMERALVAIKALVEEARSLGAEKFDAVATSAVRDASNGAEFRKRVASRTGLELRILPGIEEADGIGRGLMTDPALESLRNFHVYDLGGGSLECLLFRDRKAMKEVSIPLGCVRLTEMFVPAPAAPFAPEEAAAITRHTQDLLKGSGFPLPVEAGMTVVGTGGTLTTVRAILAARERLSLEDSPTLVEVRSLKEILALIGPMDLVARKSVRGLPASRADVFPTALTTLLALADLGAIDGFQHSLRNLRWGLAARLLD